MTHSGWLLLSGVAGAMTTVLLAVSTSAQPGLPRLRYEPPADLLHSALRPPENYESTRINASLQVYDFQPAPADVVNRFRQTLLRDWIAPQYQEQQLASPPAFGALTIAGADVAQYAQFGEVASFGGMVRPRLRLLIVAGGAAAVIDAQAASPQAWQVASPSFNALVATVRVETGPTAVNPSTPATRAVAGLYAGIKPKFLSAIGPGVAAGSGSFAPALHLYLLSAEGRVYRAFDTIRAPGGDLRRFDFDAAARADPVNSGQYRVRGSELVLTMGERGEETIVVPLRQDGRLTIDSVEYTRR